MVVLVWKFNNKVLLKVIFLLNFLFNLKHILFSLNLPQGPRKENQEILAKYLKTFFFLLSFQQILSKKKNERIIQISKSQSLSLMNLPMPTERPYFFHLVNHSQFGIHLPLASYINFLCFRHFCKSSFLFFSFGGVGKEGLPTAANKSWQNCV